MPSSTRVTFGARPPAAGCWLAVSRDGLRHFEVLFAAAALTGVAARNTCHMMSLARCHGNSARVAAGASPGASPGSSTRGQQAPIDLA